MAKSIARISGVALTPGVSRNGRLYEQSTIAAAVRRAQQRITDGGVPLNMLSFHAAADDSTKIVGRVTGMSLDASGAARYEAELADTPTARTIASLISTEGGDPYLRGVSIRGAWLGGVKRKVVDGQTVETGDDLELDGIDFTKSPGVPAARIDSVTLAPDGTPVARETIDGRTLILETVQETRVQITEAGDEPTAEAAAKVKGQPGPFADPGYQKDNKPRYPLSTKAEAKAAWSYIHQADNARLYNAGQLKRIKGRIKAALKKFGVTVAAESGWMIEPARKVTETMHVAEMLADVESASIYTTISNGAVSLSVSSYALDPHDLDGVARAAMAAICDALLALDPDCDGDVDLPGDDTSTESLEAAEAVTIGEPVVERHERPDPPDSVSPEHDPAADPAAGPEDQEEPGMAEPTTQTPAAEPNTAPAPTTDPAKKVEEQPAAAQPAATTVSLTDTQFAQLLATLRPAEPTLATAGAPAETAPAARPAAATVPGVVVQETQEQMFARLVQEGIKSGLTAAIQENVERNGPPTRKGLVGQVTETNSAADGEYPEGWPQQDGAPKPAHLLTREEWKACVYPQIEGAVMGKHSVTRQAS